MMSVLQEYLAQKAPYKFVPYKFVQLYPAGGDKEWIINSLWQVFI